MILDLFRKEVEFENIHGYDDIKDLVRRALDAYNLLFIAPPASAKTLFQLGILESKKGVYFDGSNTTNRILDVLGEKRPKIICINELDKMPRQFQNQPEIRTNSSCHGRDKEIPLEVVLSLQPPQSQRCESVLQVQ